MRPHRRDRTGEADRRLRRGQGRDLCEPYLHVAPGALSASLQPYAGLADHPIAEFPFAPSQLALDLTGNHILPDADGLIPLPEAPGLGMSVNPTALKPYLRNVEIAVAGKTLFRSASLPAAG